MENKLRTRLASRLHPKSRPRLRQHMRQIPEKEECYRASAASWRKNYWARRSQVPLQILPICCFANSHDIQICYQLWEKARRASFHSDRQRRKRVWRSHGATTTTLRIFLYGCMAINAPLQRRLSIPKKSSARSPDASRACLSIPDESRS